MVGKMPYGYHNSPSIPALVYEQVLEELGELRQRDEARAVELHQQLNTLKEQGRLKTALQEQVCVRACVSVCACVSLSVCLSVCLCLSVCTGPAYVLTRSKENNTVIYLYNTLKGALCA